MEVDWRGDRFGGHRLAFVRQTPRGARRNRQFRASRRRPYASRRVGMGCAVAL
ncbi:hypothetical protein LC55x_3030 [Lysobacter capsici]|uniref:Uncharacterized protein n=1 Tax=Lysobacter capsici AZ78 TaxID=1444315 RepID=A0A108U4U3_9GAMM|nr:hypothetical protein LC55x_3030 [Lysobacter capsici]KWS02589.1 hypothetical protein AZ78_0133 [Lysobacter capsici AZ78]